MFRIVVMLLLIVITCESRCTKEVNYVHCDSIQDVSSAENRTVWTSLYVKGFGGQGTIDATLLRLIPNVSRLQFDNLLVNFEDNVFANNGASSINHLILRNSDFPVVKAKWFSDTTIKVLFIRDSKLNRLEERCFDGLKNVTLRENNIPRINSNTFNGTSIEYLWLTFNQIRVIDENAFANMAKLKLLSFHRNSLTSFNSKLIVGTTTPSLMELYLIYNQIRYLDADSFGMFPNIELINLQSNGLEFIGEGTFDGLNKLNALDLSKNKLKNVPDLAFPYEGLPTLEKFYLHSNRLSYLPAKFFRNFPKLSAISIFENPWQCACYKQVINALLVHHKHVYVHCSREYLNGLAPVCVVPDRNSDKCQEIIENFEELSINFIERIKEYLDVDSQNCIR